MALIIIRGAAGSGKSTISKLVTERITARIISLDDELSSRGLDRIVDGAIPLQNFEDMLKELLPEIKETLESQHVILDGCFYYEELFVFLEGQGMHPRIFTLDVPVETCIKRDAQRQNPLGEAAIREVWALVRKVRKGMIIDAEKGTAETAATAIIEAITQH